MIRTAAFKHGWWYHYRLHQHKAKQLASAFPELQRYLDSVFTSCPNDYFDVGPRSSKLRMKLPVELLQVTSHEVSALTKLGLIENETRFSSAHSKVQMFMLERDDSTIAMEVPLWVTPDEMDSNIMKIDEPLTGHIDVLRIEDGKIWVWDYKPNASLEKFASTQVFMYAYMLSKRTGIPLESFRCGYFDSANAYIFKPNLIGCKLGKFV